MKREIAEIRKIFTNSDIVLIIFLIFIAIFYFIFFQQKKAEKFIEIYHHNKLIRTESLAQDKLIEPVAGIIIEIKDGKVRMKESTCRRQICVQQGWNDLFPIVCVPNQISIVFRSGEEDILITR